MPTPMPIIAANWELKSGKPKKFASSVSTAKLEMSPKSAATMGRPIATTEPKAMRRMTTAASMPIISEPISGISL